MAVRSSLIRRLSATRAAPVNQASPFRNFSAEHAPPVKLFGVHARYANATYAAASKQGLLAEVETELLGFKTVLGKNKAFGDFLGNPTVPRGDKVSSIEKIFEGDKTSMITQNLMSTMAANNRIAEADKVVDAYVTLMKAQRGEVDAVVTSAAPLTKAQTKKVTEALKTQLGDVSISTVVDPSILGGVTVQVGDKFMDLSVSSKINSYARALGAQ